MESINLEKTKQATEVAQPTPAKVTADLVSTISANRQNDSITGTSLPDSNATQSNQQSTEQIKSTVTDLNNYVQRIHRDMHFSTHEETGHTIITVTDGETGEEIYKIPSEELLTIAAHLAESLEQLQQEPENGLFIDSYI